MIELDVQLARNSYLNSRILPIRTFSWRRSRTKPDINVIFILQPWISTDVTCENVIREIFIKREGSNMREGWHFKFLWIHQNLPDLTIFETRSKWGAVRYGEHGRNQISQKCKDLIIRRSMNPGFKHWTSKLFEITFLSTGFLTLTSFGKNQMWNHQIFENSF